MQSTWKMHVAFVPPTRGRRRALAAVLLRNANLARKTPITPAERRMCWRLCLARLRVLFAPGPLDLNAYDRVTGTRHGFFIDWRIHREADVLYRTQGEL